MRSAALLASAAFAVMQVPPSAPWPQCTEWRSTAAWYYPTQRQHAAFAPAACWHRQRVMTPEGTVVQTDYICR
jgi:hypothetical protein